jgi:hypothetical protein
MRRSLWVLTALPLAWGAALGGGCNSALGIGDPTVQESDSGPDVSLGSGGNAGGANGQEAAATSNGDGTIADARDAGVDVSVDNTGGAGGNGTTTDGEPVRDAAIGDGRVDANAGEASVGDGGQRDGAFGCGVPPCTPVLLLSEDAGFAPRRLAQDDTYLYWTQLSGGLVGRTHKVTGQTTRFFQGGNQAQGIATDDAAVYWVAQPPASVNRCPRSGCDGGATRLSSSGEVSRAIALDDRNVYWTDDITLTVRSVPKTGGDGGSTTLWQSDAAIPLQIAADGQRVYVTADNGLVYVLGVDGGVITTLGTAGTTTALGIAQDDRAIYWVITGFGDGVVDTAPKANLAAVPLASSQSGPNDIASDGTNIYWINFGTGGLTGSVMTCPIASCATPTVLARGLPPPLALVVDNTSVYWVDNTAIWKLAK